MDISGYAAVLEYARVLQNQSLTPPLKDRLTTQILLVQACTW